jgi:hypothetical protein
MRVNTPSAGLTGEAFYEEGRLLYTEEINAAIRAARAAGASEIVAMDCHGAGGDYSFNSLIPDLLDPGCEFVVQSQWTEYTAFLEAGCDAALFIGMHAVVAQRAKAVLRRSRQGPPACLNRSAQCAKCIRRAQLYSTQWRFRVTRYTSRVLAVELYKPYRWA